MSAQRIKEFIFNESTCSVDFTYWQVQFESYLKTSYLNLNVLDENRHAGYALLQCCGNHIQASLQAVSADYADLPYTEMRAILTQRYLVQNERLDVYRLACMRINDGETLQDYVARLRPMATVIDKHQSDKVILNKLISDTSIHELCGGAILNKLLKPTLDLKNIVEWSITESLKTNLKTENAAANTCLNVVNSFNKQRSNSTTSSHSNSSNSSYKNDRRNKSQTRECFFCGYDFPHKGGGKCPALGKPCSTCKELNHFSKCCPTTTGKVLPTKKVYSVRSEPLDPNNRADIAVVYISLLTNRKCDKQTLLLNGNNSIKATPDTGAEVDVCSALTYQSINPRPRLSKCTRTLMAFNAKEKIPTLGQFTTQVTWQKKTKPVTFIVIDSKQSEIDNLLCFSTMLEFDVDFNTVFKSCNATNISINSILSNENANLQPLSEANKLLTDEDLKDEVLRTYEDLFENRVGLVPNELIHIKTRPGCKIIKCPPQFVALKMLNATKDKIDKWVNDGIMRPVKYGDFITWISSLNPVEKAHGKNKNEALTADDIRLTFNCKNLNKEIIREPCSALPDRKSIEYDLNGATIFSKIDIHDAFSTLPLDEETSLLFTFSTPWGLYRLNRLVQGVSVSSEIYQNYMCDNFKDIQFQKTCIDDFLIYGKTNENSSESPIINKATKSAIINHNTALFKTLDRCRELNLTLNKNKCEFGITTNKGVTFYGNHMSYEGMKPTENKVEAFLNTRNPQNKHELMSFLGTCAAFSARIPNMCANTPNLNNLKRKYVDFVWTQAHTDEMNALKQSLITKCLAHFDKDLPTIVYVDAGPNGIGALLTQQTPDGNIWLVSCGSHSFSEVESRFSQVEKETLGPVWALLHFKWFLIANNNFTIMCDNEAVVKVLGKDSKPKPTTSLRILSWISKITNFNYKIQHIKGKANIADFISRCHNTNKSLAFNELETIYSLHASENAATQEISTLLATDELKLTLETIIDATKQDATLIELTNFIKFNKPLSKTNQYIKIASDLSIHDNHCIITAKNQIILPKCLEDQVIKIAHLGHLGANKCINIIRRRYLFNQIDKKVTTYINNCIACAANTGTTMTQPMITSTIPPCKWYKIAIDHSSQTPDGHYLLVITDLRSSYPIMKMAKNMTSATTIKILTKYLQNLAYHQLLYLTTVQHLNQQSSLALQNYLVLNMKKSHHFGQIQTAHVKTK